MQQAAAAAGCGLDWTMLAGVQKEESDFGRNPAMFTPHDGGHRRPGPDAAGNWVVFAPSGGNPFDPHDALTAAARFLCAHGAAQDIRGAQFADNHLNSRRGRPALGPPGVRRPVRPALGNAQNPAAPSSSTAVGAQIVKVAETWLNVPYHSGGASRTGIDCSGLVMQVFAQFGVQLQHNAQLHFNAVQHIPTDQLQPGDLVFFAQTYSDPSQWITHVGIYISNSGAAGSGGDRTRYRRAWCGCGGWLS